MKRFRIDDNSFLGIDFPYSGTCAKSFAPGRRLVRTLTGEKMRCIEPDCLAKTDKLLLCHSCASKKKSLMDKKKLNRQEDAVCNTNWCLARKVGEDWKWGTEHETQCHHQLTEVSPIRKKAISSCCTWHSLPRRDLQGGSEHGTLNRAESTVD